MRRFFHSVSSGYVLIAANTVFIFLQVPLALHYLPRKEFGLWALVLQLTGYLQLVDLGMSPSVSRHLIDHKDDKDGGSYGSLIQTAGIVLFLLGAIVFVGGVLITFLCSNFIHVEHDLQTQFRLLMIIQCAVIAVGFPMRIFNHILTAHQRGDVSNYCQIGLFLVNYLVLWLCFAHGRGLLSLAYAQVGSSLYFTFSSLAACFVLKLFPSPNTWGRPSWLRFSELFTFGKDVFWVFLGTQMISASQTIVITRSMGLDVSGVWAVATRAFTLMTLLVWRPFDLSYPALSEMVVHGERDRLLHRFRNLVVLSCSTAVVGAVMFALCNKPFVELWTHGKVTWNSQYDVLLGLWLIVLTLVHCHCGFVVFLKRIGLMKYVYFIEGAVFLTAGSYATSRYGIAGLLATSVVASLIFSCSYGIWRTVSEFKLSVKEVAFLWLIPSIKLLMSLGGIAFCTYLFVHGLSAKLQLVIYVAGLGSLGALLFVRFALTTELRQEILLRVPARFRRAVTLVLGADRDASEGSRSLRS